MACELGLDNLCAYLTDHGSDEGPGGLSEYLAVDASDVMPLVRDRTAVEAALVEPLACVLNSLSVASVEHGSRLAIVGNGFMGILHARAAQAMGANVALIHTGPSPVGLEYAWEGSRRSLHSLGARFADRVPAIEDGAFDAVIVIRGMPQSAIAAAHLVRPAGVVSIYASRPSGEDTCLPGQLIRRKQIRLTAAASHRRVDFADAARLIGDGSVVVADLVHCTYPLAEVQEALTLACEVDSGRVIVALDEADASSFA
jgi:L-iditol 2-dehydrogenase